MNAFIALFPVFIVILIGYLLRRSRFIEDHHWLGIDQICYYVLFPAIIFKEIAAADFSRIPVWSMGAAMMLAISTMFALLLTARSWLCTVLVMDGPAFTSLFQGATRWHTFIALALVPIYFGNQAIALVGLSAAAMIPLLNLVNVAVLAHYASGRKPSARVVALSVVKNPFVLSSVGGVLYKFTGLPLPGLGYTVLDMVGRGSLGLALLAVGAGLRLDQAVGTRRPVIAATALKLLLMPVLFAGWLWLFGVTGPVAAIAILSGSVPTGSGAYVLARQMGGDAPLVANILTVQVLCAAVTIPLIMTIVA
ncbi:MAG: AEC family transporter [Rhizobiales bacterium]|nr:AEC family transporter [Hyphomicrobiales bacterium]